MQVVEDLLVLREGFCQQNLEHYKRTRGSSGEIDWMYANLITLKFNAKMLATFTKSLSSVKFHEHHLKACLFEFSDQNPCPGSIIIPGNSAFEPGFHVNYQRQT